MKKLLTEYYELLQEAEQTMSRKEAIKIIQQAAKLREEIMIVNKRGR
jgi:hypothetical protein